MAKLSKIYILLVANTSSVDLERYLQELSPEGQNGFNRTDAIFIIVHCTTLNHCYNDAYKSGCEINFFRKVSTGNCNYFSVTRWKKLYYDCQKVSIKCLGQFGALLMPSSLVAYQMNKLLTHKNTELVFADTYLVNYA